MEGNDGIVEGGDAMIDSGGGGGAMGVGAGMRDSTCAGAAYGAATVVLGLWAVRAEGCGGGCICDALEDSCKAEGSLDGIAAD